MVMFDFSNTQTLEYKSFINFVDEETNKPINIEKINKDLYQSFYAKDLKPGNFFSQKNFLTQEECEYLIWLAETVLEWPKSPQNFWDERNLNLFYDLPRHHYAGVETAKLILSIHSRIKDFLSNSLDKECFADQIGIVRWPPGSFQPPHIDDVPGLDRVAGCIIYLNEDYIGGETFYPHYGSVYAPKTGSILVHDSSQSHLHGVTKIKEKTRYTIFSTWTDNPYRSMYERQIIFTKNYLNIVQPK
jgi:2OG-Fe(II) oxygenase superfamily